MSEMSLKIAGKRFEFFNKFNLTLQYNSVASVFSFDGLITNDEHRNLFKPLSFHDVQVLWNNELILTGIGLNTSSSIENTVSLGNISGYSKPGVLEDCEIPLSLYPLEFNGLSLRQITEKIIKPFGLKLIVDSVVSDDCNKVYDTISAKDSDKIKDFICDLAKQRKIIVSHDTKGNLVFTRLKTSEPSVATYIEGMPTTRISVSVNGQAIHSELTVQKQASLDVNTTGEQTIKNNLIAKYRPTVKKQTSGDNDDTEKGAEMERASELRAISVIINTDRWQWTDGKITSIIKPNHIIEVQSPSNFINKRTRFIVEKIDYNGDQQGATATITAVLPEVYTGEQPKNIFA